MWKLGYKFSGVSAKLGIEERKIGFNLSLFDQI